MHLTLVSCPLFFSFADVHKLHKGCQVRAPLVMFNELWKNGIKILKLSSTRRGSEDKLCLTMPLKATRLLHQVPHRGLHRRSQESHCYRVVEEGSRRQQPHSPIRCSYTWGFHPSRKPSWAVQSRPEPSRAVQSRPELSRGASEG